MAQQFQELAAAHTKFIEKQKIFFVATAAQEGRVNLSPKGHDSLKITGPNELIWMNLTGSGNETAAHLADTNRMTIMWCAFEGPPRILRVYGEAETIHPRDPAWEACEKLIPVETGSRQYYRMKIDLVQTSCGYAVPLYEYEGERDVLRDWADKKGRDGVHDYWDEKNQTSIDGLPTGVLG
ncbi:pyridoxamine 5'-phosphate oxidase family protein [Parvibaculaceae bacterium PLY_AMNH_Bact1]|nr:pyridoxamine 5'-phosphate oxidase family protein [Parvibaculaceae bacterium PLY_AMNH_Bact1]